MRSLNHVHIRINTRMYAECKLGLKLGLILGYMRIYYGGKRRALRGTCGLVSVGYLPAKICRKNAFDMAFVVSPPPRYLVYLRRIDYTDRHTYMTTD